MLVLTLCALLVVETMGQYHDNSRYEPSNELTTPRYPRNYYPPAPVHYVNIGSELAGDYKFGYDTGKGPLGQSFREETRLPDGTVKGAYGVLDEHGRQRIIRYTAGKDGFKAEGDVGPDGAPKATFPGPAPAAPAVHQAAPVARHAYRSAPAVAPIPVQQYTPPVQQYNPPVQQYNPPVRSTYRNDGQWNPEKDDPYYQAGPAFIDVERLSYNIGSARQNH